MTHIRSSHGRGSHACAKKLKFEGQGNNCSYYLFLHEICNFFT